MVWTLHIPVFNLVKALAFSLRTIPLPDLVTVSTGLDSFIGPMADPTHWLHLKTNQNIYLVQVEIATCHGSSVYLRNRKL